MYRLQLIVFIILCLYFGQSLLIPFSVAILLTIILSPVVNILERYIGRIISVLIAFLMLFFIVGTIAFALSKQLGELAVEFPKYKTNVENKLNSFDISQDNPLTVILSTVDQLANHLPGKKSSPNIVGEKINKTTPITVVEAPSHNLAEVLSKIFISLVNVLGSTGLIFLLLLFTLFAREDLRGRLIRLIGSNHISATAIAMNDAGQRVTSYLLTQLLINFIFGAVIAIGLFCIGIPNALLWGGLAMVLRFIPYLGTWIAAIFPVIIAFAISPSWTSPILLLYYFLFFWIYLPEIS